MKEEDQHDCISREDLLEQTRQNIEQFGLQVIMVSSTEYLPSFAYSVGLEKTYKHPEIICFGLSNDLAHKIINDIAEILKKGEAIQSGKVYDEIFNNSRAYFLNVDKRNIPDYFGSALNYYQDKGFDALQLIWTDRNDKFPWEENFEEEFLFIQPLLDRNAEFKFYEPKNLTTFTTKQWLEESKPILRVVHDNDGDWQFLTGDQMPDDIRIVALEELIKSDQTLNNVFDLDYGEEAERSSVGGKWTRYKLEDDEEK
ncbi:protein of unknown function [Chryseobacterium arachidis]|uniref:DUF4262 domain-containing protein n=1 Tax=Chryseobacterium arachidis TaxID=1416778 RepID=A0A1M4V3S5_9FLAO|nr:DUF4262 domain-containing protein [Chryseobacterium arachidis]SHE63595.1 protein of unknown function [Chryseobacterium arachidis]